MNVIFLDIDGVLNYKAFDEKNLYNYNILRVDINKIKLLSEICKKTNSKVVLSSSWKINLTEDKLPDKIVELATIFYENGIDLIGVTPNIPNKYKKNGQSMWKEWDIKVYLYEHKDIKSFCIIDDENYDLHSLSDHLVQTKWKENKHGDGGLMDYHLNDIKKILSKKDISKYR